MKICKICYVALSTTTLLIRIRSFKGGFTHIFPPSGAWVQGEYAGLRCIMAYHAANRQLQRNVCLIPISAHGTNPASAAMSKMKIVIVQCDEKGDVDVADLKKKAAQHSQNLAALMITYPSARFLLVP